VLLFGGAGIGCGVVTIHGGVSWVMVVVLGAVGLCGGCVLCVFLLSIALCCHYMGIGGISLMLGLLYAFRLYVSRVCEGLLLWLSVCACLLFPNVCDVHAVCLQTGVEPMSIG